MPRPFRTTAAALATAAAVSLALAACSASSAPTPRATTTVTATSTVTATPEAPEPAPTVTVTAGDPFARPDWIGATDLVKTENGLAEPVDTPAELEVRQLAPRPGAYPDPETDDWFVEISAVPDDVLARSSWKDECPVAVDGLAYIVMPFWGFDLQAHTGEMLIAAEHAEAVAGVFEQMFERRFPIEEMRVTTEEQVNGTHHGDQNVTIAFECRKVTGGFDAWSEHAKGLAVDINPFQNPFYRDGYVFPELAGAYLDREWLRPGMIETQRAIIDEFAAIGWGWGGSWDHMDDWMHFSATDL